MAEDAIKMLLMDETDEEMEKMIDDVKDILDKIKANRNGDLEAESEYKSESFDMKGYATESLFAFGRRGYYWIVLVNNTFAFMRVSADWIETYSNVVLESSGIFVEYCCNHRIKAWAATQAKEVP